MKLVNGVEVELTPGEVAEYNQREADWETTKFERLVKEYTELLELTVNNKAVEKSYKNGISCASYVASTNPQWAAEAKAYVAWRDAVYSYAYEVLNRVTNGEIEAPSIQDFLESLPILEWP